MNHEKEAGKAAAVSPWAPIFLCWLAYTAAYLGRYSYSSNITAILDDFGVSHADTGLVTTCFFFAYGIGQVVNGLLCKRYNARWVIAFALIASSVLNLAVFLGAPFSWLKYLWLCNGAVQSMLWPTLIFCLARVLAAADLKKSVVVMSTTVPFGTFLIYGLSALLAISGRYEISFLAAAAVMLAVGAVWFLAYPGAFRPGGEERAVSTSAPSSRKAGASLAVTVAVLGLFAAANNLVKDGLTTWAPSILRERFGLHESLSIFLTLLLPMLGMLGAACNTLLEKKIHSFISLSGVWYLLTALCMGAALRFVNTGLWGIVLLAFGCISLFMHGVNNAITSMAPLYMRERINSGLLAGLLNGCCYVGSTLSSYGLGAVADRFGWGGVFLLLLGVSCVPAVIAPMMSLFARGKEKRSSGA